MALTLEELQARQEHIGGSDVPAILGLSPWKTITDVFLEKTKQVELKPHPSLAAEIGDRLEPTLVQWARDRLDPEQDLRLNERFHHDNGIFAAQVDGWLPNLREPIEAKTAGLVNGMWRSDDWGDDGTDQIPLHYLAQVNFQMLCTGADRAHVIAFLGAGVGPRFYLIERHATLIQEIHERCERFWNEHVQTGNAPEEPASLSTLKDRIREPLKMVALDEDIGNRYLALKDQESLVKNAVKDMQTEVLTALGDAEIGDFGWGQVTYTADKRGRRSLRIKEKK